MLCAKTLATATMAPPAPVALLGTEPGEVGSCPPRHKDEDRRPRHVPDLGATSHFRKKPSFLWKTFGTNGYHGIALGNTKRYAEKNSKLSLQLMFQRNGGTSTCSNSCITL